VITLSPRSQLILSHSLEVFMLTSTDRGRLVSILSGVSSDLFTAEITNQPEKRRTAIARATAVVEDLLRELRLEQIEAETTEIFGPAPTVPSLEELLPVAGAIAGAVQAISGWRPRSTKDRALVAMEEDYLRQGMEIGRFPETDGLQIEGGE
jgi:hypothetical protein